MRISELEERKDFDYLVILGHEYRAALAEYENIKATLSERLSISTRDANAVAKQLDNWYKKHDNRLPSEVVEDDHD